MLPAGAAAAAAAAAGSSGDGDGSEGGADVSNDVAMRAIELGMDLKADRSFLWLAAEALEAPLPDGWEARSDAMGQTYYA